MRNLIAGLMCASALALSTMVPAAAQSTTTVQTDVFVTAQPTAVLSSNLNGLNVKNEANETIGEIKDIVIADGKLAGYVVSVGGFLGIGERYVVVSPASLAITYSEDNKAWSATMNATKDNLKAAPEFKYEGRWGR